MRLARATSRHFCFMSRHAARSQRPPPLIAGVCPNKIPTKLVFHWSSLAEFPVILQYISTKSQQKKFPRYRRCAGWRDNSAKRNIAWARLSEKDTPGTLGCCIGLCWAVRAAYEIGPRFSFRFSFSSRQRFRTIFGSYFR